MKKIVLGCAAVLLSLGLLAGCNNDTDSAVSITVDTSASVVVGETLELPYSVEPEKAKVEALSDHEEYVTAEAKDGVLSLEGIAAGDATVTLVGTYKKYTEANVNIKVSVVPEGEVDQEPGPGTGGDGDNNPGTSQPGESALLGSFDFSECTENGTSITSYDALDEYWVGETGIYEGAREHDTVYFGNGSGGAFANVTTCLKFGAGSGGGTLQLKFTIGTVITSVVVAAHSWDTSTVTTLTINDITQGCSISGEPEELTYEFAGNPTDYVTMKTEARVTVHSIDIYGYYDESVIADIETLTLSADSEETMNVGDARQVYVSWTPEDKEFDIDTLEWESDTESVAKVEQNEDGALITAVGGGSATITATATNGVSDTIEVEVEDVLVESETFVASALGYSNEDIVSEIDGHQIAITFDIGTNTTSTNLPKYYNSDTTIRVYSNNTVTFTPTYEEKGATISTIEIVCYSTYYGNEYMTFTDAGGSDAGTLSNPRSSGCTITLTPSATGAVTLTNWANEEHTSVSSGGTQLRITSITVNYTLADN